MPHAHTISVRLSVRHLVTAVCFRLRSKRFSISTFDVPVLARILALPPSQYCTQGALSHMNEQIFLTLAQQELSEIVSVLEAAIDSAGIDADITYQDGVVEIEFDDTGKIVLNQHLAMQEIWLAARLGAYHFSPSSDGWRDTRGQASLRAVLARALLAHSGGKLVVDEAWAALGSLVPGASAAASVGKCSS